MVLNHLYTQINVVSAATRSGVDRSDIARQLNNWELDGTPSFVLFAPDNLICCCHQGLIVDCKASQVRAVSLLTSIWKINSAELEKALRTA